MFQVTVPGKLIISGEHAVVYGYPALAASIARFIHVRLTPIAEHNIELGLAEYHAPLFSISFDDFFELVAKLESNYQAFLAGKCQVTDITSRLYELPLYALGLYIQHTQVKLEKGLRLTISGDLPMGYGLGSSAAVIVAILRVADSFFNKQLSMEALHTLAVAAENLQHGHSSGLDASVCLHEGLVLYQEGKTHVRSQEPWMATLVNTGQQLSSTGECVEFVRQQGFGADLWSQFASVTLDCDAALKTQDNKKLHRALAENHRLLCRLGIVPVAIQDFVAQLEQVGATAKICGAGSVSGNSAGYLWISAGESLAAVESVVQAAGYELEQIRLGVVA